jgi:hypothetical protein
MTLPGLENDAGTAPGDTGPFGLSGRWSMVTLEPSDLAVMKRAGGWLVLAIGLGLAAITLISVWPSTGPEASAEHTLPPAAEAEIAASIAPGSLGVKLADVAERWNEVALPPRITGGFLRNPESGQFDSFTYRFNQSSLLAGAYDPINDYVYAVMASSWLSDESAARLNQHVCHLVSPYSQECLDAFAIKGLVGQPLESYRDLEHQTEWTIGEQVWRLHIVDNIQTIRVVGPGAG